MYPLSKTNRFLSKSTTLYGIGSLCTYRAYRRFEFNGASKKKLVTEDLDLRRQIIYSNPSSVSARLPGFLVWLSLNINTEEENTKTVPLSILRSKRAVKLQTSGRTC